MGAVHVLRPKATLFLLECSMYQPQLAVREANAVREEEGVLYQDIPNPGDTQIFVIHCTSKEK